MKEIILGDDEKLEDSIECLHNFKHQADINVRGIIYDIYFCTKCLLHVKKERPCPYDLEEMKN